MQQPNSRTRALQYSFLLISSAFGVELTIGLLTGSLALIADALHAFFDVMVTVMLLATTILASKPPDIDHTYGHGKIESLGSLLGGIVLTGFSLSLIYQASIRIQETFIINPGIAGIGAALFTLCVDVGRIHVLKKPSDSLAVRADLLHAVSDFGSTLIALTGVLLANFQIYIGDSIASIILGAMLIYLSTRLIKNSMQELSDRVTPSYVEEIRKIIKNSKDVKGIRKLRVRKVGDKTYVDASISVRAGQTIDQAHLISTHIENNLKQRLKDVIAVIHVEPSRKGVSIEDLVRPLCLSVSGVKDVHKVSSINVNSNLFLTVHVLVNPRINLAEAHQITDKVENILQKEIPSIDHVLVHIEPYADSMGVGTLIREKEISKTIKRIIKRWKEIRTARISSIINVHDKLFISITCKLDKELSVEKTHNITEQVKKALEKTMSSALIEVHAEPAKESRIE